MLLFSDSIFNWRLFCCRLLGVPENIEMLLLFVEVSSILGNSKCSRCFNVFCED